MCSNQNFANFVYFFLQSGYEKKVKLRIFREERIGKIALTVTNRFAFLNQNDYRKKQKACKTC